MILEKGRETELHKLRSFQGHRQWWAGEGFAGLSGRGATHPEGGLSSPQLLRSGF